MAEGTIQDNQPETGDAATPSIMALRESTDQSDSGTTVKGIDAEFLKVCEHVFFDEVSHESVSVKTLEDIGGRYGLYTWPCAHVLAWYVSSEFSPQTHPDTPRLVIHMQCGAIVSLLRGGMCAAR